MIIRKAIIKDIKSIHRILGNYSNRGLLLPKSLSELYDHLRDYYVVEANDQESSILGTCALGICWEDLAEIRSLAVVEGEQGKGHGIRLVEACLEEARTLGLENVFVLTYIPDFFERFDFKRVSKSVLPHKIWADCLKCIKFPDCDETAMMIEL